jgi:hypothetical protein
MSGRIVIYRDRTDQFFKSGIDVANVLHMQKYGILLKGDAFMSTATLQVRLDNQLKKMTQTCFFQRQGWT